MEGMGTPPGVPIIVIRDAHAESKIAVGEKAPSFALENQDDETVKLSDFKGRWIVLYFYPKDDTPGCTTEACDFTAGLKGFEKLDAVVLVAAPIHRRSTASSSPSTSSRSRCCRIPGTRPWSATARGREEHVRPRDQWGSSARR